MIRSLDLRLVVASLLLASGGLSAQPTIFLDRSYVVRMTPTKGFLYEGQPAIPLFLYRNTDSLYSSLGDPYPRWSTGRAFVLTPLFVIRQLSQNGAASQPVRTPSFMPKLTAQFVAARRIRGDVSRTDGSLSALVLGVDGTFGHYSNGQAGCFRANYKPDVNGRCLIDGAAGPGSDTLNTVDGGFSTWYFRAQTRARFAHYRESLLFFAVTLGAGVDWHPSFLEPMGGMDSSLAAVYGRSRPFGSIELKRRTTVPCLSVFALGWLPCGTGRVRATVKAEYIRVRPPGISPVATTSELAWTFDRCVGFGAIVRLHRGQDYYNIALGHELNVIQYGFTFDLERNDPIRHAPQR